MIDEIDFVQYRKLKNIKIQFHKGVNLISGTNGTCKSTLMHIVSNSFQALKRTDPRFTSTEPSSILGKFVDKVNPKIETVSRGDKSSYSNPANGKTGVLFSVKYLNPQRRVTTRCMMRRLMTPRISLPKSRGRPSEIWVLSDAMFNAEPSTAPNGNRAMRHVRSVDLDPSRHAIDPEKGIGHLRLADWETIRFSVRVARLRSRQLGQRWEIARRWGRPNGRMPELSSDRSKRNG